ncbi:MAG: hypothetical protein KGN34_16275 [Sphingomonadales bacterium]|nr:hypothetical protein [Sphingomonadales bacterium]
MKIVSTRVLAALALLGVAGCGQVLTRTGMAGPALAGGVPLAIAVAPTGSEQADRQAGEAVKRALELRGHAIRADAPTRIEVALAGRAATEALDNVAGGTISPARRYHVLQSCHRRIDRLTLAVYEDGKPGVTRAWAEEHHCHGAPADSLPALAERALAVLHDPAEAGQRVRRGRD